MTLSTEEASRTRLASILIRAAGSAQVLLDVFAWTAAAFLAVLIRFDFDIPPNERSNLIRFIPIAALVQCAVGLALGLYRRRWRYGSFDEVAALMAVAGISTVILWIIDRYYLNPRLVPLSAVLVGGFVGLVLMAGVRYVWRLILERRRRPGGDDVERLLVFGAGDGGIQVISSILRTPKSPYLPVGIIDDDPAKRRLSIMGVNVVGTRTDVARAAEKHRARLLLIAVPSAGSELISEVTELATACGLFVKVLPPVEELFGNAPGIADIRDLTEADLLGRHHINTDLESIAGYLTGKRVLVTGAGGSIGAELCRQLVQFGPERLIMLDRDESALHAVQLSIEGRALLDSDDLVLADIRDREAVARTFERYRPQVVFHAAALKHLPLLESHPSEAVKSNVQSTLTVLRAAQAVNVERFVNISTDKAANPISVLGYSKRVAERLTAAIADESAGTFLSVRFGNVLGSRGSVLTTFHAQIAIGGPVTVTHPDVTRYFMTVREAVQLVIQAGAIGRQGEVLVLDMGRPVRIADVASRLTAQANRSVKIVYTGLRPGEKLHEDLFGDGEIDVRPRHPLISHAIVPVLPPSAVDSAPVDDDDDAKSWLQEMSQFQPAR